MVPATPTPPAGRLKTRTWARGLTTTYHYDPAGRLTATTYSDSSPESDAGYDRLGRLVGATNSPNAITRSYDLAGNLLSESFNDNSVVNTYDAAGHRTSLILYIGGWPTWGASYTYDAASGRLQTVTDLPTGLSATYSYLANSPLVSQIVFGTSAMTTTQQYDALNRLTRIGSVSSAGSVVDFQGSPGMIRSKVIG